MPTIQQYLKKIRKKKLRKIKMKALMACPQKRGLCFKIYTTKPKKPNSANRKIAQVRLSTGRKTIVGIPGQGFVLQKFSSVLIRGGGFKDVPGVKYKMIRGKYDLNWREDFLRSQGRSKYGIPKDTSGFVFMGR